VLGHFRNQKGCFSFFAMQREEEIRGILNLFRASLISFPRKIVMEEAEIFSTMYLKEALQKIWVFDLSQEVRQ
jgi:hypothetical protein